jgi:dienelactone hydrolase
MFNARRAGVALAGALAAAMAAAGGRFDPADQGGHVTIRVGYALRTASRITIDGALEEKSWAQSAPLGPLVAGSSSTNALRHAPGWHPGLAQDATFVRLAHDDDNLYLSLTALTAPRPAESRGKPPADDMILLRLDPGARGRHMLQLELTSQGLQRAYDSHETWGYTYVPALRWSATPLTAADAGRLGAEESAALRALGEGASGWCMELAIPWKDLANSPAPAEGEVWGLQVERSSAAGEHSAWGRNTFNGFDPQGHVSFVARLPDVVATAFSFGRSVAALTPWCVYLENRTAHPAAARLRLGCSARTENEEFRHAQLEPGEAQRVVSWIPYSEGLNRVEAELLDAQRRSTYRVALPALVRPLDADQVVDRAGGYARIETSRQVVAGGEELELALAWENDIRNRSPLGDAAAPELRCYLLPDAGAEKVEPLPLRVVRAAAEVSAPACGGGRTTIRVTLPPQLPQGFARLVVVPVARLRTDADGALFAPGVAASGAELAGIERHAELSLANRLYVRGAALEAFTTFVGEARKAVEAADGQSLEEAVRTFWKPETLRFPQGKAPAQFAARFGAGANVRRTEAILQGAAKDCAVLRHLPLLEADLRMRLAALAAGKLPERGVLWKAYQSKLDGEWQPYCLYVPEHADLSRPLPLVVDLHGYGGGWEYTAEADRVAVARREQCLLLKPYLRGRNWYVGWGEREMLDLLDVVRAEYPVDPERTLISGFSMGGCGTMKFMASYPDIFAAGAGSAGRAEPLQGERTGSTPSWVADAFKDQGTPWTGGRMFQLHAAEVEPVLARHRGELFAGHGHWQDNGEIFAWLLAQPLERWPKRVNLTVYSARFASLRWVRQVEPARYGESARVTAEARGQRVELATENVAGVRLELSGKLVDPARPVEVVWNGRRSEHPAGTTEVRLGTLVQPLPAGSKRPGELAGPLDDFITRKFVIVQGTLAEPQAAAAAVKQFLAYWEELYQGRPQVVLDTAADEKLLAENHLLCVGGEASNDFLRRHAAQLPLRVDGERVRVGSRKVKGADAAFWYLTRNPLNADRYLLVAGAVQPARVGRALEGLYAMPARHWDFAVYGGEAGESKSAVVTEFARAQGLAAFGWLDRQWQVDREAPLLPASALMDNLNPSLSLTPQGGWRSDSGPQR